MADSTDIIFSSPSQTYIIAETCIQSLSSAIFLFTSDVFITLRYAMFLWKTPRIPDAICLRMYALSRSKILTSYFVTLALARSIVFLTGSFLPPSGRYDVFALDSRLSLISVSIGTAFGA